MRFRGMLGVWCGQCHRFVSQACPESIDERYLCSVGFIVRQQAEIAAGERHRFCAFERDGFNGRRQRDTRESLAQHADQMCRHSRRRTERERHLGRRHTALLQIMLMRQREREPHRTKPARGEPGRELVDETIDAEAQRFVIGDRYRQFEAAREMRRRHIRHAGIGASCERTIERRDETLAAAARQCVAW